MQHALSQAPDSDAAIAEILDAVSSRHQRRKRISSSALSNGVNDILREARVIPHTVRWLCVQLWGAPRGEKLPFF